MNISPKHDWRNAAWIAFLVTLFALAVAALSAKPASAAEIADTVVQIGGCSGVCVDPSGIVLTVKHCGIPEVTQVRFRDRTVMARKLYETTECDGPVVFDCEGEGYPFQPIASRVPNVGDGVWSVGYPAQNGTRQLTWGSGKLQGTGEWKKRPSECGTQVNRTNIRTAEGWSGGPLLTPSNEVCGLLLGGNGSFSCFASYSSVRQAYDATCRPADTRPVLYVFTSANCQPCRQFKSDYESRLTLKVPLDTAYTIRLVDIETNRAEADRRGVRDVPAFVRDGHANVVGYTTPDDLLMRLGLKQAEVIVERPPVVIAAPSTPSPAPLGAPQPSLSDRVDKLAGIIQTGLTVASWVGVGVGTGGIGAAVLWGLSAWRAARKVKQVAADIGGYWLPPAPQQQPPQVSPVAVQPRPPVITTENPPPPQVVVPTTQFAPYERDTFAEAFAWAKAEHGRRYPGSVSVLEAVQSMIDQYLASKGITRRANSV